MMKTFEIIIVCASIILIISAIISIIITSSRRKKYDYLRTDKQNHQKRIALLCIQNINLILRYCCFNDGKLELDLLKRIKLYLQRLISVTSSKQKEIIEIISVVKDIIKGYQLVEKKVYRNSSLREQIIDFRRLYTIILDQSK